MARPSKPNYWSAKRSWYCRINGVLHKLAGPGSKDETRKAAEVEFHRLMAGQGTPVAGKPIRLSEGVARFLAWSKQTHAKGTYQQYQVRLSSLVHKYPTRLVADLRPSDITNWVAGYPDWSDATKRQAITYAKVLTRWLVRERLLATDPIASVKRPRMPQRSGVLLSPEDKAAVLAAATGPFRLYVEALIESGARPGEIALIEARHIDWEQRTASFPGKTTKATGKLRVIYFTDRLTAICRELADKHPEGPIFRNHRGKPWTRNAIRCRMRRLPVKAVAYAFRHTWVTEALERNVAPALVAELAGHSDLTMISAAYSHLREKREALSRAASQAVSGVVGECAPPPVPAPPSQATPQAGPDSE